MFIQAPINALPTFSPSFTSLNKGADCSVRPPAPSPASSTTAPASPQHESHPASVTTDGGADGARGSAGGGDVGATPGSSSERGWRANGDFHKIWAGVTNGVNKHTIGFSTLEELLLHHGRTRYRGTKYDQSREAGQYPLLSRGIVRIKKNHGAVSKHVR